MSKQGWKVYYVRLNPEEGQALGLVDPVIQ